METDCKYLFIYGSLMDEANEFGAYLQQNSSHVAEGHFNGLLYDMGEYPGAVYAPDAITKVYGEIRLLNNPADALKIIDEYEGYGPDEVQPNLFIRHLIAVQTGINNIICWVYLYNLGTEAYKQILSGKYKA